MRAPDFTIVPSGQFSLAELARFGFGQRAAQRWAGVFRLAFCLDGYRQQVGVEVRQDEAGVHGVIHAGAGVDTGAVQRQVARVLSLDYDGEEFAAVGKRDPVVRALQAAAPGLRPPLFYSPYEAAAWAVLSARRPARQAAAVRASLSEQHGATFSLAGESSAALPTPAQLLQISEFPGIPAEKIQRLHGIAAAALDGLLDADRIKAQPPDEAMASLRQLSGIGPFYSTLIVIRGSGLADVLPVDEPRLLATVGQLYQLGGPPTPQRFAELAEPWRPFRTWTAVLIRAAASRLSGPPDLPTAQCVRRHSSSR